MERNYNQGSRSNWTGGQSNRPHRDWDESDRYFQGYQSRDRYGSYGNEGSYHTGSQGGYPGGSGYQEGYGSQGYGSTYGGGYGSRGEYGQHRMSGRGAYDRGYSREDDRNFFERAGDRIRETWNDWTDRDDDRGYQTRGDDRNLFERAGDKIREKWNDWTEDDERDYRARGGYGSRGYSGDYRTSGRRSGDTGYGNDQNRRRSGGGYQGGYGHSSWGNDPQGYQGY